MAEARHFAVTLVKSGAGRSRSQRLTLAGLGLGRLRKTVFLRDTPPIRGMLYKVAHLVQVQAHEGMPRPSQREKRRMAAAKQSA